MKIAVTGGNGDMGRSLVAYLLEEGHEVVSIDLVLPKLPIPRPARLPRFLVANVTDFGEMVSSMEGCDAVVHLAAHRSPLNRPNPMVYADNTVGSYNVLYAAALLGIKRVCQASSINAIGGVYSRVARYDYFPVDEEHPTHAEDPYSLSKWVMEQQGDAFARRYDMTIASLRFHWLLDSRERALELTQPDGFAARQHLWAYTLLKEANRACLLSLTADFSGHEVFYIVAPRTAVSTPSPQLAQKYFPETAVQKDLADNISFFDCHKAERLLGWTHEA